jgi:serine/threonine protein phosphatase PrpC
MEKDDSKSSALSWCLSSATDIGGSRENQDDMFIWEKKEFDILVLGLLDGHG